MMRQKAPGGTVFANVILALKFDSSDADLLDAVVRLAPVAGVRSILLVHLIAREPVPAPIAAALNLQAPPTSPLLDQACARLAEALPGVQVTGAQRAGELAAELGKLANEHDADLLLLGRKRFDGGGRDAWGSVAFKLLHGTTCPVLVIPQGSELRFERVVVGTDFSRQSIQAVQLACGLAPVVEAIYQVELGAVAGPQTEAAHAAQVAESMQAHFAQEVRKELDDPHRPQLLLVPGNRPADVLVSEADCDLLVVGSRGLSALASRLLGSVAERAAGRSNGPVLIVRKKGEQLGLIDGLIHR